MSSPIKKNERMSENFPMKGEKYDIVMFNMATMFDFDHGVVNRNYHVLNRLARDERVNRIIACDFFPIKFKTAIKHYIENILFEVKHAEMIYGDLTSVCYRQSEKIIVYSSVDSIFSWKAAARELRRIEKVLNLQNVIFWSYNPLFIDFIGKLREKLFVFDTVDNWSLHPEYIKLVKPQKILENYRIISDRADLIFTVSENLLDFYHEHFNREENIYRVPNGVDFEHYNDKEILNGERAFPRINEPIIGYLGTIEERLDFDLIARLAELNPDKKIALCGPIWKPVAKTLKELQAKYSNIIATGRIHYAEAPRYLNRFAVAIIPHKITGFTESMNPMKIYEYLAAGLPIVSTVSLPEFSSLIKQTTNPVIFNEMLNESLAEDSAEKRTPRRLAVKPHSWEARVDFMLGKVFQKL
jgi:glycosyltransferase involved in cell wall biosynthesis